jgi:long-chain fatty acid transport protein
MPETGNRPDGAPAGELTRARSDAGYSHLFVKNAPLRIVVANPQFVDPLASTGGAKGRVDIVSLALKYRWDDPQVAIPAAQIVRK